MRFGHLIVGKIFKFVATRCHVLRLKCIKFNFGSPVSLAGFLRPTSKGREGRVVNGRGREEGWGEREQEGEDRGGSFPCVKISDGKIVV